MKAKIFLPLSITNSMESEFIRHAKNLAEQVFKKRAFDKHLFHNYQHTQDVVDAVRIVGQHTNLSADEMESALIAAWLHDLGYENGSKNHEEASAQKAKELLETLVAVLLPGDPEGVPAVPVIGHPLAEHLGVERRLGPDDRGAVEAGRLAGHRVVALGVGQVVVEA